MIGKPPKFSLIIGLDPGTNTGFAVWSRSEKRFIEVCSMDIISAIGKLREYHLNHAGSLFVRIEDPHQRKWFGKNSDAKKQGAGSIKRDFKILLSEIKKLDIPFHAYAPKDVQTKVKADYFKKLTGWEAKTNEHSRDAGMSIYGF
jgi:hypothetical protein